MLSWLDVGLVRGAAAGTPGGWVRPSWPLLAFALAFPAFFTFGYFVALADAPRWLQQGAWLLGKLVQFGLPAAWWLGVHRRLPRPAWPGLQGALAGGLLGLAMIGVALVLRHDLVAPGGVLAGGPAEAIRAKVTGLGVAGPWRFLALAAFYSVIHSGAEEYYWRWFVFGGLRSAAGAGPAILCSSLGFAAHHVVLLSVFFGAGSPMAWALSLAVAGAGAFWAWLYQHSGSLVGPWLSHLLVDTAIFAIGWELVS